ncbi:MAG: imidazoleglycerol-phosphate dehydratase HisB [Deltaproteobacteria bacterium]|nr:imidazoleglycerol-phosphate dehydratase HisB [Deltaproteobacteria bacterium]MBW2150921.1 imidazoleglycerol-phosphate dehydratase HisB [Deltaproteobacteria bacterium]
MLKRSAAVERKTKETSISVKLHIDGNGTHDISTGVPFFDHMLTLLAVHGFFDLFINASGDLEVDWHHTVEDVGLVLGDALSEALNGRKKIVRFGHAEIPMDDALAAVTIDLSNRPFLVYNVSCPVNTAAAFNIGLAQEFFRAFATRGGMNLHINLLYGQNEHHIIESIFKATARSLDQATAIDKRITSVRSSKGTL